MNETDPDNDLVLRRTIDAPRMAVWRCWTEPALLQQWFCPKPWYVSEARVDPKPGGELWTVMNGPEGERFDNAGVFLEVVTGERLVFTDAFTSGWQPSGKAFMVGCIELSDMPDGKTRYVATARHWTAEDRARHEEMGFHEGWTTAADQMEALARTLAETA